MPKQKNKNVVVSLVLAVALILGLSSSLGVVGFTATASAAPSSSSSSSNDDKNDNKIDIGYQQIFDSQICPGLKTVQGQMIYSKYCKNYTKQSDLDHAEHTICTKYPTDLKDQCAAYRSYTPGSATASTGAGECDPAKQLCSDCSTSPSTSGCADCSKINCTDPAADPSASCGDDSCDIVKKYVNPLINLFSIVFGLIATISLITGGIQYSMAGGDPQKVAQAKDRITKTILATVAYMFLFALLQFLVPGGIGG